MAMHQLETLAHPSIGKDDIRQQLDRILEYPDLEASERRRAMLKFVVEEALAGRASTIKATTIAMAVFGRGADFDQQADPVVRLEARKLRRDLDNYYAGVGRTDPVVISIPKGRYIPKFTLHDDVDTVEKAEIAADLPERDIVGEDADTHIDLPPRAQSRWLVPLRRALIAAAVILCAILTFLLAVRRDEATLADADSGIRQSAVTILIEPFDAPGNDVLASLLAIGLADEIAAALIKFPDLRVHLANGEDMADRGDSQWAGLQSLTQFVVRGTVRHNADEYLVRVELVRNADGEILWSERFNEALQDRGVISIQDAISSRVSTIVGQQYGLAMSDVRTKLLSDDANPSLSGFACVTRAQLYRRTTNPAEYRAARDCLEETVRRNPGYSRAWAMLAYLRNDAARFDYEPHVSQEHAYVLAREAAAHALVLDPQDTDALKAMSHIEQYAGDINLSVEYARRAVESNPYDPDALANLGYRLGILGRFSEAVPLLEQAIERSVSPPPFFYHMIAMSHMMDEEWDAMLTAANLSAASGTGLSHALLAVAHGALGHREAASENLEKMAERWPRLAEDPRTAFKPHKLAPDVVEAFVVGLSRARTLQSE